MLIKPQSAPRRLIAKPSASLASTPTGNSVKQTTGKDVRSNVDSARTTVDGAVSGIRQKSKTASTAPAWAKGAPSAPGMNARTVVAAHRSTVRAARAAVRHGQSQIRQWMKSGDAKLAAQQRTFDANRSRSADVIEGLEDIERHTLMEENTATLDELEQFTRQDVMLKPTELARAKFRSRTLSPEVELGNASIPETALGKGEVPHRGFWFGKNVPEGQPTSRVKFAERRAAAATPSSQDKPAATAPDRDSKKVELASHRQSSRGSSTSINVKSHALEGAREDGVSDEDLALLEKSIATLEKFERLGKAGYIVPLGNRGQTTPRRPEAPTVSPAPAPQPATTAAGGNGRKNEMEPGKRILPRRHRVAGRMDSPALPSKSTTPPPGGNNNAVKLKLLPNKPDQAEGSGKRVLPRRTREAVRTDTAAPAPQAPTLAPSGSKKVELGSHRVSPRPSGPTKAD